MSFDINIKNVVDATRVNSKVYNKSEDHVMSKEEQNKILNPGLVSLKNAVEDGIPKLGSVPDVFEADYLPNSILEKQHMINEDYKGNIIDLLK